METDTADALRIVAVIIGGASFSVGVLVIREWVRRLDGYGRLAARVFGAVHLLVVLFIALTLAEHAGEPLNWRAPMALTIFTTKLICLSLVYELQQDTKRRGDPPQRRAEDKV